MVRQQARATLNAPAPFSNIASCTLALGSRAIESWPNAPRMDGQCESDLIRSVVEPEKLRDDQTIGVPVGAIADGSYGGCSVDLGVCCCSAEGLELRLYAQVAGRDCRKGRWRVWPGVWDFLSKLVHSLQETTFFGGRGRKELNLRGAFRHSVVPRLGRRSRLFSLIRRFAGRFPNGDVAA